MFLYVVQTFIHNMKFIWDTIWDAYTAKYQCILISNKLNIYLSSYNMGAGENKWLVY